MNHFRPRRGQLHAEQVPIAELAEAHGTPLYVYSTATITRHWKVLARSLRGLDATICYAVKANSNLAVLDTFARLGAGFDIVSGGELYRVLKAGGRPSKVVFSGVGKRDDELAFALDAGVGTINVESAGELARVAAVARRLELRAPVALRVNPDVDPRTHPYIATGLRESKFGVPVADARRLYQQAVRDPHLDLRGIACHIGSQITSLRPFVDAVGRVRRLAEELATQGIRLRHLDVGGGLGVTYRAETPPSPAEYGAAIKQALRGWAGAVHLEPGRVLVGNAGVLVTRVLQLKRSGRKLFVVVDAAMNDLVRPAFYDAWHEIEPVARPPRGTPVVTCDVVGPICESGDFLAKRRKLVLPAEGDLLCVRTAGAYGFTMASNYNSRPRAAEVLVDGSRALLARERETYPDLVRGEALLPARPRTSRRFQRHAR